MENKEYLGHLRHSAAHLLAAAVSEIWPDAKRTIGPAIDNGFYFDFDFGKITISEEDFPVIEKEMKEILKGWSNFERIDTTKEEALQKTEGNEYKKELIEEFSSEGQDLTFYKSGNYEDLCKGGHVENPFKELGAFKLLSIAGAYWRGNEKNKMLTRIYGTAFSTEAELEEYLNRLEEAKKRDHRKLGKELGLFTFSELVGSGLPLFTPKGTFLRTQLAGFSEELQREAGFEQVWIPHITKTDLYKVSGHWDKFAGELFIVKSQETDDVFVMKPMNCPHHTQIYASQKRSYRELPIRYFETTTIYRDEKAGELSGLSRVRSATQDDAHIFCRMDQIEGEFTNIMNMIKKLYSALGLTFKARLSFRDAKEPTKYHGDDESWNDSQKIIEDVAKKLNLDYFIAEGEAAFYGPKIDIMVIDSLAREWQCATEQLDFIQPKRFGLTYIDSDGQEKMPVMIHKALLGSVERFLSVYIEHTAGNFPLWLCYTQAIVVPISGEKHNDYAYKIKEILKSKGIRTDVDDANETLGNKIRKAQANKIPYVLVIGDKEMANNSVNVRLRGGEALGELTIEEFANIANEKIKNKVINL